MIVQNGRVSAHKIIYTNDNDVYHSKRLTPGELRIYSYYQTIL